MTLEKPLMKRKNKKNPARGTLRKEAVSLSPCNQPE